jgi:3-oxoacyl-[acyl-carrier protein] reductase
MDLQLKDKVALVAGSSRGIGKATARAFLLEGCRTVITGRDGASLTQAAAELEKEFGKDRVLPIAGDLTQTDQIRKTLDQVRAKWAAPDCVVASIGTGRGPVGWKIGEADWQKLFETNLFGSLRLVTEVLPAMTESRKGSIVIISSIVGVESTPAPLPYSAAKAALNNFQKNVARQVGPSNVRINCVAPGNILFPGGSWETHIKNRGDEVKRYIETEVPLQRFGRPEEIADLIVYLSSERASFITGSCIVADGGQTRSI